MSLTQIDFSAQFGGRDAAAVALPHFKALKAASRELRLEGFPFPKLAFILRVDGEINQYQISGAGNIKVDSDREYLSIDIGIAQRDQGQIFKVICDGILSSIEQIAIFAKARAWNIDSKQLANCFTELIARYKMYCSDKP